MNIFFFKLQRLHYFTSVISLWDSPSMLRKMHGKSKGLHLWSVRARYTAGYLSPQEKFHVMHFFPYINHLEVAGNSLLTSRVKLWIWNWCGIQICCSKILQHLVTVTRIIKSTFSKPVMQTSCTPFLMPHHIRSLVYSHSNATEVREPTLAVGWLRCNWK